LKRKLRERREIERNSTEKRVLNLSTEWKNKERQGEKRETHTYRERET